MKRNNARNVMRVVEHWDHDLRVLRNALARQIYCVLFTTRAILFRSISTRIIITNDGERVEVDLRKC